MSKFCANCGAQMDDESMFCSECGTRVEQEVEAQAQTEDYEAPAENYEAPVENYEAPVDEYEAPAEVKSGDFMKKIKENKFLVGFVGFVAVVVLIIVLACTGGGGYKSAIDTSIAVTYKGKAKQIEKLAPKEYWEWYEDQYDADLDDVIDNFEDSWEDRDEALEDDYGKNYKVSYKVEKSKKLSDKKLKAIATHLKDKYDISKKDVKEAMDIDIELTIKGSEDDDSTDISFYLVKVRGDWYIIDSSSYDFTLG